MRRSVIRTALAVGLTAAMAIAVAGCSSGGSGGGDQSLVVYSADPANAKVYKQVLKTFGDENHVKVSLVSYTSADFVQNFTSAVNGGSQIDALLANGQDVRFLKSKGLLRDIHGVVDTSTLQPAAYTPFQIDKGLYGAGVGAINVTAWVYNADIFKKYGLTPPKTMDDVKAIAQKLQGTGIAPVSVPGGNIYLWPMWVMQALQQTSGNKPLQTTFDTLKKGDPSFTTPQYVDALKELGDLGSAGIFANGYQALQQDNANSLFSSAKAAMFFGGTWDVSSIVQQAPNLDLKLVPFPSFTSSGVDSASFGGIGMAAAAYSKAPDSKKPLIDKLIKYLAGAKADSVIMGGTTSAIGLPTVKAVKPTGTSPLQQEIITNSLPTTVTFLDWYWPKDVTAAFQTGIQEVVGGKKSASDLAKEVQQAFDSSKSNGWTFN